MARAAAFVLSSAFEGLPGALIQAMACSRPVVSTDCPSGPAEILGGGRFGAMVWVGDDHAMAVAIPATLDRPIARADLFNVDRAVDRYVDLMFDQGQAAFRAAPAAPVEERPG
jgi:glycosyltransferase involved in cell wall biosynthesis